MCIDRCLGLFGVCLAMYVYVYAPTPAYHRCLTRFVHNSTPHHQPHTSNEPHGLASWGESNPLTDYNHYYERLINRLKAKYPDWKVRCVAGVLACVVLHCLSVHGSASGLPPMSKCQNGNPSRPPVHPHNNRGCGWWRARSTTTRATSRPCRSGGGATWRAPSSGPSSWRTPMLVRVLAVDFCCVDRWGVIRSGERTELHHQGFIHPPTNTYKPKTNRRLTGHKTTNSGAPHLRAAHLRALGVRARLHEGARLPQ